MEVISYKAKSLGYRAVGSTTDAYTNINGVMSGLTIQQDAPDVTAIEHEFSEYNLEEWDNLKPLTIEFDLVKFSPDQIVELMGGTYDVETGMWNAPSTAARVRKEIKLSFREGLDHWIIYNAKVSANWDGADLKTAPVKLHVVLTALSNGDEPAMAMCFTPEE